MATITITDRDDLRPGDNATFEYVDFAGVGHPNTGPLWAGGLNSLLVGGDTVRFQDRTWSTYFRFVSATRTVPDLPTEPGSVIHVYEVRGKRFEKPVLAVLDELGRNWLTSSRIWDLHWHAPEDIADWRPVEVTEVQP